VTLFASVNVSNFVKVGTKLILMETLGTGNAIGRFH
jgi:hypothetical protein